MKRAMAAAGCAVLLAGCGGSGGGEGGGGVPGMGGDFRSQMGEPMKPCDAANKETPKALTSAKGGKLTWQEARVIADVGVAACDKAQAAWEKLTMPAAAAEACLAEARAKAALARAQRTALDHQVSPHYKKRIDRQAEIAKREAAACKAAPNA